jgi:ketosteroid isomerase-like protein
MKKNTDPTELVLRFVAAVNRHAVEDIASMLTSDHLFIDSLGTKFRGRATMREGWAAYFAMVPDYAIAVEGTITSGDTVAVFGNAGGTFSADGRVAPERQWRTPAAWRAVARGGRLAVWQVYADNDAIRQVMARRSGDSR